MTSCKHTMSANIGMTIHTPKKPPMPSPQFLGWKHHAQVQCFMLFLFHYHTTIPICPNSSFHILKNLEMLSLHSEYLNLPILLHLYCRKYTLTIPVHVLSVCKTRLMTSIIFFTCCKPSFWHLQKLHTRKVIKLTAYCCVWYIKSQHEKRVHHRSHALAT